MEVPVPVVVYLHGNSGSRMDADDLVDFYLEHNISVFSVDFSGFLVRTLLIKLFFSSQFTHQPVNLI